MYKEKIKTMILLVLQTVLLYNNMLVFYLSQLSLILQQLNETISNA